ESSTVLCGEQYTSGRVHVPAFNATTTTTNVGGEPVRSVLSRVIRRRRGTLQTQHHAAHMEQIRASIARQFRDEYDLAQPLPRRLAELVRKLEHPARCPRQGPSELAGRTATAV